MHVEHYQRVFRLTIVTYLSNSKKLKGGKPVVEEGGWKCSLRARHYVPITSQNHFVDHGNQSWANSVEKSGTNSLDERHCRWTRTADTCPACHAVPDENKQSNGWLRKMPNANGPDVDHYKLVKRTVLIGWKDLTDQQPIRSWHLQEWSNSQRNYLFSFSGKRRLSTRTGNYAWLIWNRSVIRSTSSTHFSHHGVNGYQIR